MFADRIFIIAFSFSLVWHLLWMSSVSIVVPENLKLVGTSGISFLGPILDKTAFDMIMEDRPDFIDTTYRLPSLFLDSLMLLELPSGDEEFDRGIISVPNKEKAYVSLRDLMGEVKKTPTYLREPFSSVPRKMTPSGLEGPVSARAVLFKPELPKLPQMFDVRDRQFSIKLKFYVLPDGKVESAEPVLSSGYPDIDLQGIRYIKNWQFEPKAGSAEREWGIVHLKLETE